MNETTTKRWVELSEEMAELLHKWADEQRRSDKAQAELILERALIEYRDSTLPQKTIPRQKAKAA